MSIKSTSFVTLPYLPAGALSLPSVLLLLPVLLLLAACSRPPVADEPIRAVRTVVIAAQGTGATLEFAGEVRPRIESRLGFRVAGKVVRRNVEVGASVKAGQVLAQLDPKDLRLAQDAARATLAAARTNVDLADSDLKRYRELKDQGFISAADLERRSATLASAQSSYNQAQAQFSVQGNQADYALLVADSAGIVTGVDVEPGTVVAAGAPAIRVAQDGPRDVVFSVPEDKLALIRAIGARPGAPAGAAGSSRAAGAAGPLTVRPWNDPAAVIPARVREVAASADPATRTYLIKADVGNAPLALGQTATVLLALPAAEGLTRLPLSAITESQGKAAVWLLDAQAMSVRLQPIGVGSASGDQVVVSTGLAAGDEVVTAGVHVLTPGEKVKRYVEPYAATPPSPSTALSGGASGRTAPAAPVTPATPAAAPNVR